MNTTESSLTDACASSYREKGLSGLALTQADCDRVANYLSDNPYAALKAVAKAAGVSTGSISKMPVWQEYLAKRKGSHRKARGKDKQLPVGLASGEPSHEQKIIDRDELFRVIVTTIAPDKEKRLEDLTPSQRNDLIDYLLNAGTLGNVKGQTQEQVRETIRMVVIDWLEESTNRREQKHYRKQ